MKPALLVQVLRDPATVCQLDMAQWGLLLRQSHAAKLSASLVCLLDDAELTKDLPAAIRAHLEWTRVLMARHADAVHFEIQCIREALADLDVPVLLLKGAAYSAAGLPPARGRLFNDIDVMVPKARLAEAEVAFLLHGWHSQGHDAYDERYYRQWMHEIPPIQHMKRQSVIDLHHAILPETARVRPDPARLQAAAVDVPGLPGIQTLAPADMILHSAVHLFYDGEFDSGLRDLVDLHRLLGQFGTMPGFWDALPARAVEMQLGRPLFYALRYSNLIMGTCVPTTVVQQMASAGPNRLLLALMDGLFLRGLQPAHASADDMFSAVARSLLYIRGNWLRMPPFLLARHLFHKAFISPKVRSA